MRNILAVVLLLLTMIQPASATELNQFVQELDSRFERLRINIFVDFEKYCYSGDNETLLAAYFPAFNALLICKDKIENNNTMLRSVIHETVHLVQDCKSGLANERFMPIFDKDSIREMVDKLSPRVKASIETQYEIDRWMVEIEAHYLSGYPERVLELFDEICLGNN